jgi:hypothetical protein
VSSFVLALLKMDLAALLVVNVHLGMLMNRLEIADQLLLYTQHSSRMGQNLIEHFGILCLRLRIHGKIKMYPTAGSVILRYLVSPLGQSDAIVAAAAVLYTSV